MSADRVSDIRVFEVISDLESQAIGRPQVIRIQEGDEVSLRHGDSRVASRREPSISLGDVLHTCVPLCDASGVIGRTVVHDNHFERFVVLNKTAIERFREEPLSVVHRDDDAH